MLPFNGIIYFNKIPVMHILFLENEGSWREQCLLKLNTSSKNKVEVLTDLHLSEPINNLTRYIEKEFPYVDLFLINVNVISGGENRSGCAGIKLFKFLRLYHLNQHCVLYSFLNREQLMQLSPEHLIIFSEGISFIRLPFDFGTLDFDKLAKQVAPDDLSRYLKAESHLPDDRHFFANWWGVLQLWKAHRYLHKIDKETSTQIEKKMFQSANQKDSYQGKLAEYLYSKEIQQLSPAYIETQKELHTNFGSFNLQPEAYEKQLMELKSKIDTDSNEILRLNIALDEIQPLTWWQRLFTWLSGIVRNIRRKVKRLEYRNIESLKEEEQIKKYKELINFKELDKKRSEVELENLIAEKALNIEIKKKNLNDKGIFNIQWFIQKLKEKSPKILYIDDQADEGWAIVFQYLIYGQESPENFTVINPEKTKIEDLIHLCFANVDENNPDLIILDLRLYGEKGVVTDYDNLSGIKVLKALKNGDKTNKPVPCPIMVVTASNKATAHNTTNAYRADASWIKEGLDNHFSLEDTVDNYLDFLRKVFVLCCNVEFGFLRKMKGGLIGLRASANKFWWESEARFNHLLTQHARLEKVNKSNVFAVLEESILLLETLLHEMLMNNSSRTIEISLPSLITIRLFQIIEDIHYENYEKESISKRINEHHKFDIHSKLDQLVMLRNNAAHCISITMQDLNIFFTFLIEYLEIQPNSTILKHPQEFPSVGTTVSQNKIQTNKRYTSVIIKKKFDCILISKNADELQKDFAMNRNLKCVEKKILNDVRCIEDATVEFEVKQGAEEIFLAFNVTIL